MLITSNVHTHTTFCDGKFTPEDMVLGAIGKGFDTLGISPHSYAPFDKRTQGLIKPEEFIAEMHRLQDKYRSKIDILIGIELDYYGIKNIPTDYVIGSVHYVKQNGDYFCFESGKETAPEEYKRRFGGERYAFPKLYYDTFLQMVKTLKPDILGHYDILTKFNAGNRMFDENDVKYRDLALDTAGEVLKVAPDSVFEVNTHAMYRNYRTQPYPSDFILRYLAQHNAKIMLSSDSHNIDSLGYKFSELCDYVKSIGFTSVYQLKKGGFIETKL